MATSVLITWEAPETALSCIEEYTIKTTTKKCLTNPTNCIWTYLNSSSINNEATIISLQPCTDYVLYVYANGRFSDEDKPISFRTAFQGKNILLSKLHKKFLFIIFIISIIYFFRCCRIICKIFRIFHIF